MLLTITYKGENATDPGFLFHKNPQRPQVFDLNYGKAFVFYPEAGKLTVIDAICNFSEMFMQLTGSHQIDVKDAPVAF